MCSAEWASDDGEDLNWLIIKKKRHLDNKQVHEIIFLYVHVTDIFKVE